MKFKYFLMLAGLMLVLFSYSSGQVPQMINYQGKLTKSSGVLLDTTISMVFSIYADTDGTTLLWTETQLAVKVDKGIFNVLLGSLDSIPDSVFDGNIRYLGVKVGADPEIIPRKPMVSVPYAYTDGDWTKDGNNLYRLNGRVGIGTSSPLSLLQIEGSCPQPWCVPLLVKNTDTNDYSHSFIWISCSAASNRCQPGLYFTRPDGKMWEISIGAGDNPSDYLGFDFLPIGVVMVIDTTGNVGIGTTTPAYKLDVAGAAHASSFPTSSDERLKKNVSQLTNVLEKLEKIRGVSFDWNELYESMGRSTGHREIGVIAQEVEAVFPELVTTWGDEKYQAVDYGRLTGVLIEAIKELRSENQSLKQRVEALEGKISE